MEEKRVVYAFLLSFFSSHTQLCVGNIVIFTLSYLKDVGT